MSSTELVVDSKDIRFVMNEWLQVSGLNKYSKFEDFDEDTINLLIEEGHKFSIEVISPTRSESDKEGCKFVDGRAIVPACLHEPYEQAYELGWASLTAPEEFGGQGAPHSVGLAVKEALIGANVGLSMYFGLTEGVCELLETFGTEELQKTYVERLVCGEFTGTMCLSEPQAGSDVGAGTTIAEPTGDGRYKIKGTKVWISSGDNDLGKNVIHAVLARLKGAPAGTKGLSLFIVPAFHVNDDGSVGDSNDVTLASIEHKMGINCSTTAVLNFGENDDCYGYLLGAENSGMSHMFQMMNGARMGVASIGLAVASAAYQNALAYAKERVQGPHINKMREPDPEKVAIIEHPDVRVMLMNMKARVEAIRALLYATTHFWDITRGSENENEIKEADGMLQLLTPMCKGWGCEVGLEVVSTGIQILGGVGYTQDFPLEQMYRDLRIAPIYEGTTGIQALDLVGRKLTMNNGALFMAILGKFNNLVKQNHDHPVLGALIQKWGKSGENLAETAMTMQSALGQHGMEGPALYATSLLMHFSAVTAGYFLLEQGLVASGKLDALKQDAQVADDGLAAFVKENSDAQFYDTKLKTIRHYINIVLPSYEVLTKPLKENNFDVLDVVL